ncbi:MAG: NAD(P)H-hydrate epimerase [Firmicutes bacterium]|nr:NAD(P)H-hydrate epimerase [Bacillota bacterium]
MKKNGEHFVTCGQMKVLERRADESGLSYYRMMENAGSCAASMIMEPVASYEAESMETDKKVYVFCGKGNNGGDGFVVARLLHDKGYKVTVILVDGEPKTQDAITNYGLVRVRDIRILDMAENNRALMELGGEPDIIVDAVYGTGFKGELKSNGLKAAIYINRYSKGMHGEELVPHVKIVALDIPSGLGGDVVNEKLIDINSIRADFTVTFHAKKPVHVQKFAPKYCGEIRVADIGIDEEKLWNVEI